MNHSGASSCDSSFEPECTKEGIACGFFVPPSYAASEPTFVLIEAQEVADYGRVRVTTVLGQTVTMEDPRVEANSIKSRDVGAVPLSQVTEIKAFTITKKKGDTLLLVGTLAADAASVAIFNALHWSE